MPQTSTAPAAPQAPAVARPPFAETTTLADLTSYVAARLNYLSGAMPDGSPRFAAAGSRVVHLPSRLSLTLERNTAPASRGIQPAVIECPADRLHVPGAGGASLPGLAVKLYASGEFKADKVLGTVNAFAIRQQEANERRRLITEREDVAWTALRERIDPCLRDLIPAAAFPAPPVVVPGNVARVNHAHYRWEVVLTPARGHRSPMTGCLSVSVFLYEGWDRTTPFDPEKHGRVEVMVGRDRYAMTTVGRDLTVREGVIVASAHAAALVNMAHALNLPAGEPATDSPATNA